MIHTLVHTRNINQASLLTCLGGELIGVEGHYPNNVFIVKAHPLLLWYEKHIGLIPYRKYCNQRIRLKERGRKLAHLPKRFTGQSEGFRFEDIAHVRPFAKAEAEMSS